MLSKRVSLQVKSKGWLDWNICGIHKEWVIIKLRSDLET